jgi:thioredoxin
MLIKIIIFVAIGAGIGAMIGRTRSCETGACPLTANPRRGALWGGFLGLLLAFVAGPSGHGYVGSVEAPIRQIATSAELDAALADAPSHRGLVVFHAEWCGACRRLEPTVEALAAELGARHAIMAVDVEASPELANRYGVRSLPTIVVLEAGTDGVGPEPVERIIGLVPGGELRDALADAPAQTEGSEPMFPAL